MKVRSMAPQPDDLELAVKGAVEVAPCGERTEAIRPAGRGRGGYPNSSRDRLVLV